MKNRRRIAGLHAAEAALENAPDKIISVWIDHRREDGRIAAIAQKLASLGIPVQPAGRNQLDSLAESRNHQGIVIELKLSGELGESELQDVLAELPNRPFFLVLDHVQDPHNLGACLRTADAAGVQGIIITKDQSVGLTPTVAKVASGAAETVPVYRVTNLNRVLGWLKEAGLWIVGAAGEAEQSLYEIDLAIPLALVIGAEGKGLRRLTRESCDFLVKIPMFGQIESLNLSVATGVLLFEAVRQRARANRT
ncbi:23S rRNA (guanosine(2251)-2'-O)-methyltransferase RlmB [Methylocaldum sp.]|uniref:23S rRNA (guanosine(2251)-2'-O)-methyltransferase RlmB n=1 Tax=Methylocaldum sp. TaxID=1969727 RepID=UPI002D5EEE53|nr:23S rRNA (guanosine(2251)-2'-O)-methyltransferase RlmB [Methylocaldum sp.]HYE35807.1 23S rRNA (guanosine(2251)-2'-O)-methyltransferase RlmB [Methylocaldum sp.]